MAEDKDIDESEDECAPEDMEDSYITEQKTTCIEKESHLQSEHDDAAEAADEAMRTLMQNIESSDVEFDATAPQMEVKIDKAQFRPIKKRKTTIRINKIER